MKFEVDSTTAFELLAWHKTLIKNDIPLAIFEADMKRRAQYSIEAPVEKAVHFRKEKLNEQLTVNGVSSVPGDLKAFSEFVGDRDDLSLSKPAVNVAKSIKADEIEIFPFTPAYQSIAITYLQPDESAYACCQIEWVLKEKIKGCLRRMHAEWDPKLSVKAIDIPLDDETFVNLVISQPDYKDRATRDAEAIEV